MLPKPVDYLTSDDFDFTLPPGKSYVYVLAGNGVFKSPFLTALIPLTAGACRVAGLPKLTARVEPRHRIPSTVLHEVYRDARRHHREVMYHLRWNDDTRRIIVAKPRQEGTTANVSYHLDVGLPILCDVHSHPGGTHFSSTDNRDETEFRFYAVIHADHVLRPWQCVAWRRGRLRSRQPEIRLRLGMYDDHYPVPATTLFTDTGPFTDAVGRRERGVHEGVKQCRR